MYWDWAVACALGFYEYFPSSKLSKFQDATYYVCLAGLQPKFSLFPQLPWVTDVLFHSDLNGFHLVVILRCTTRYIAFGNLWCEWHHARPFPEGQKGEKGKTDDPRSLLYMGKGCRQNYWIMYRKHIDFYVCVNGKKEKCSLNMGKKKNTSTFGHWFRVD